MRNNSVVPGVEDHIVITIAVGCRRTVLMALRNSQHERLRAHWDVPESIESSQILLWEAWCIMAWCDEQLNEFTNSFCPVI